MPDPIMPYFIVWEVQIPHCLIKQQIIQTFAFIFRVVPPDSTKDINGHVFTGWGAHAQNYRCAYLTAAAAIGMSKEDVDIFLKRLDKCLAKFTAKDTTVARNDGIDDEEQGRQSFGCENGQQEITIGGVADSSMVNR